MKREVCPICKNADKEIFYKRDFSTMGDIVPFSRYSVSQCNKCGFIYAGDIDEVMPLNDYYDELSKYETEAYALSELSKKECNVVTKIVSNYMNYDCNILDVGCGNGNLLHELKKCGYYNISGIEPSKKNVDFIKRKYYINAYVGAVGSDEIPIDDNSVDLIIMTGVLEHIMNIDEFLNECLRYLSSDGYLCISVPDVMQFCNDIDLYQQFSVEHINFFNKISIENLLGKYGFTNIAFDDSLNGEIVGLWKLQKNSCPMYKNNNSGKNMIIKYIDECSKLEYKITAVLNKYINTKIYVWGAGTHTAMLYQMGILNNLDIINIIDGNENFTDKEINGISVKNPKKIDFKDYPILISSQWAQKSILEDIRNKYKLNNDIIMLY